MTREQKATKTPEKESPQETPQAIPGLSFDVDVPDIPSTDGEGGPSPVRPEVTAALAELKATPAGGSGPQEPGPETETPAGVSLSGALIPVWRVIDGIVVRAAGSDYALEPQEIADLADASGPVIDRYLPDFLTAHPELFGLALAVTGIYSAKHLAVQAAAAEEARAAVNTPQQVPDQEARE